MLDLSTKFACSVYSVRYWGPRRLSPSNEKSLLGWRTFFVLSKIMFFFLCKKQQKLAIQLQSYVENPLITLSCAVEAGFSPPLSHLGFINLCPHCKMTHFPPLAPHHQKMGKHHPRTEPVSYFEIQAEDWFGRVTPLLISLIPPPPQKIELLIFDQQLILGLFCQKTLSPWNKILCALS